MRTSNFLIILLLTILFFQPCDGQEKKEPVKSKAVQLYEEGKKFNEEKKYSEAIRSLNEAVKEDKKYADAWNLLGTAYNNNGNYKEALEAFKQLEKINPEYWPWFYYQMGQCHENLDHYEEAIASYEKFLSKYSTDPDRILYHHYGKYRIAYINGRKELLKMPDTMPEPENLGPIINSSSGDYFPQIDPTGTRLYFTSQRKSRFSKSATSTTGDFGEDIYYAVLNGVTWSEPVLLSEPINSVNHDGAATFSGDGQTMVYGKCSAPKGIGDCDLYVAQLEGDHWSEPVNLGNVVNSKEWDAQPTLSADGTKIIFSSDRPGGYGGTDLYQVEKNLFGDWGIPQNLGPVINTPWNENSPHLAPDGTTLYFSSVGHPGYGGSDLFKSTFEDRKWTNPVNLGRPLNSESNDRYFTISSSGEYAYFATNRVGGNGLSDIYRIKIPEGLRPKPSVVVSGKVTNAKTGEPTSSWVLVEDLSTGEMIATNKSNSTTGAYLVVLPAGKNYSVSANKDGFFFYSQSFDLPKDARYQEIKKDIKLTPIEKGAKVVMNNIFFETGKANLKTESYLELAKAVELMKSNKSMKIEVGGHTDDVGSDESNLKLSHERAKSVMDFMIKAGVEVVRIQAKGYGETQPVASNTTEAGRQSNRRTEFVILEF